MKKRSAFRTFCAAAVCVLCVTAVIPFVYILWLSFFGGGAFTGLGYYDVFLASPVYLLRFWSSLALAAVIALGQLAVSVFAGYGFAKYRFPGRRVIFFVLMMVMVLPLQVTLVPNYIMLDRLHLLDTYAALALPAIFSPLGTFILTQCFGAVPDAISEAAALDGAGVVRTVLSVFCPMNKSGLVCAALLSFLDGWNMVEQPIAYLREFESYTISVALAYTPPAGTTVQFVCCLLVLLPPLFLFTRYNTELVEGIALAEIKG